MAIPSFLIRFNAARPAVDARGVFTKEVADALTRLFDAYNASVEMVNSEIDANVAATALAASPRFLRPETPAVVVQTAAPSGSSVILQRA